MVDIDFKYLEFWTYYSSEGDIEKNLGREWCFSTIFDGDSWMCNSYELYIYRYGYKKGRDNNCLITKRQLIQHLNEIKNFYKEFEYELTPISKGYKLNFTLDCALIWHKIILSWIRYSYEFPFNIAIYEAFKVKKLKPFKEETMLNLFNLIGATMNCTRHGTAIHAIGEFYNFKELISYGKFIDLTKDTLEEDIYGKINYIIPRVKDGNFNLIKPNLNYRINHTDYWKNKEYFKERLTLYINNYNILKIK